MLYVLTEFETGLYVASEKPFDLVTRAYQHEESQADAGDIDWDATSDETAFVGMANNDRIYTLTTLEVIE